MGEVYRAKDTRLDRTVAIKVLPSHLSGNAEIRQRFEREARAVSSLAHPHICTLYDVGQQDGIDYLVMEFIEGESLADRLKKGALAAEQTLRHAIEIADALDKAHRAGIVHRDLKPGNVMITKTGAKLLDFGLAKLLGSDPAIASSLTSLPTERHAITDEGTILGTFQYMAPEQLEGKEADTRTDIFAFGAVVYEMATGKKAFTGKSQASLISSIMTSDPPAITSLQPMTPPALDRVVKKCLAKDPDDRWQSAHDLMSELKWIAEGGSQAGIPAPVIARRKARERLAWIVASILFLGLLALLPFAIAYFHRASKDVPAIRFVVSQPEKTNFAGSISISPDGRRLAFIATADGKDLLWIRHLDSLTAQALSGTEDASYPFWSPDSRFVGFFAQAKLKKIDVSGGPATTLCDAQFGRGGTWNRDGVIVFTPSTQSPLYRVSSAGGEATLATALDTSRLETSHRWPYFLPDGRHFLYLVRSSKQEHQGIYVGSLDTQEAKRLAPADLSMAYAPPGYLLFVREGILLAQPFDAGGLEFTGEAYPVAAHVWFDAGFSYGAFSVSENGVLAYDPSGRSQASQIAWFDRAGKSLGSVGPPGVFLQPKLSPDNKRVAVQYNDHQTGTYDILLFDLSRGATSRFTFDPSNDQYPVWSPDGSRIVFASDRSGHFDLYQKPSSGAGQEEVLLKSSSNAFPTDWSKDGRFIVYQSPDPKTKQDVWILPLSADRKPFPFLQSEFNEIQAQLSPDGRWMAYVSDESGNYEVYVRSFPTPSGKWPVSTHGGGLPLWRRDGKELFYIAADLKLMAVEVKEGATFEPGAPKALFGTRFVSNLTGAHRYDVSADGQRFLMSTRVEETASTPITVVLNWTADLKR